MMPSNFSFLTRNAGDRTGGDRAGCDASAGIARTRQVHAARLLPEGRLQRIEAVRGTTVSCVTGKLWITLAGDSEDHLLSAGDTFTAPAAGLLLAQALSTATFTVDDRAAGRN